MKVLLAACVFLAVACGCTSTVVRTQDWTLYRISVLQQTEIPSVEVTTNGTAKLSGYTNKGDAALLSAAVEGAVKAGITSVTK